MMWTKLNFKERKALREKQKQKEKKIQKESPWQQLVRTYIATTTTIILGSPITQVTEDILYWACPV